MCGSVGMCARASIKSKDLTIRIDKANKKKHTTKSNNKRVNFVSISYLHHTEFYYDYCIFWIDEEVYK